MMKRFLQLSILLPMLAACSQSPGSTDPRIGTYPGDPAENFSPEIVPGGPQYRNIALMRAASQSSSADYNHTAQLLTDGLFPEGSPRWTEVILNGEQLGKIERGYLTDLNVSDIPCGGGESVLEVKLHGYCLTADKLVVTGSGARDASAKLEITGKDGSVIWTSETRAVTTNGGFGETNLIIHGSEWVFNLGKELETSALRLTLKPSGDSGFSVSEVFFFNGGALVDSTPGACFTSVWKSLGAKDEWVMVDLGTESSFDRMAFHWLNPPVKGRILASRDGKKWKDLAAIPATNDTVDVPLTRARFVRATMESTADGNPFELGEWEIFGTGGTSAVPKPSPERKDSRQYLSGGGWKLKRAPEATGTGEDISSPDYDDTGWMVATVPGTVLGSYVDNGAVLHPNYADNQLFISDSYFRSDFWYRDTFEAQKDSPVQLLHFEGINWKAEVYLNGKYLGLIDGAFRTADLDVSAVLNDGTNCLAVKIIHNESYGMVKEQTAWSTDRNGGFLGYDNPTMHATIGWDWIPTVRGRNIGIYDDVYLSFTGPVTVEDPFVRSVLPLPDTTSATILAQATLVNRSDSPVTGILQWTFGDEAAEQEVVLSPRGRKTVVFSPLEISNPRLWWPRGYGDPNLYPVNFSFFAEEALSHSVSFLSGIRQMDYSLKPYKRPAEEGVFNDAFNGRDKDKRLEIFVNGRRFIGFGGNWGFPEHLLNYRSREYDIAVKYHADMNFTMIRNWVGMTGARAFYEACDRYGVMIWQDFWLANPWDGPDPSDPARFNDIADGYVRRIRNHPSLALYVGRNEGYPPEVIDSHLRKLIAEEHPGLRYIPHSGTDGVSGGGPYRALPVAEYFHMAGQDKLHSEMGMPNVMNYENMVRAMGEENLEPVNTVAHPNAMYGLHDYTLGTGIPYWNAQKTDTFNELIANAFGEPADAMEFSSLAQWINYDGYRAMFEARSLHRRGLLLWMSHPAWPSMVWQTYDYYFEPTAAYFGCKKACEPIHILYNPYEGNIQVANYRSGDRAGLTATARILNMDGTIARTDSCALDVAEDSTVRCFPLVVPDSIPEVYYLDLDLADDGGKSLSHNFYVLGKEAGNLKALRSLGKAEIRLSAKDRGDGKYTVELENTGSVPALMLRLKGVDPSTGDMALPAIWSDNYFSLMPGESRTVSLEIRQAEHPGGVTVEVSGFNLKRRGGKG